MLLNARHSAPSTPHAHILQVLVSTHPLLCCGCCGKKWICHAHPKHSLPASLPQPTRNSELSCCCSRNAVEVCGHILARMFLYQTRLVATRRRDQTQRDQTRPDQTVVRVLGLLAAGGAGILYFLPVVIRSAFAFGNLFRIWH